MHRATVKLRVKNPCLIKESLLPDVKNKDSVVSIECANDCLVLNIATAKISYLMAIINSYLSLIRMIEKIDEVMV